MKLVTVDPGVRKCGWALFEEERLVDCGWVIAGVAASRPQWVKTARELLAEIFRHVPSEDWEDLRFAVEQMHSRSTRKEAWESLLEISRMTGAFGAFAYPCPVELVSPTKWTGRMKKEKHQKRTKLLLTPEERDIMVVTLAEAPVSAHSEVVDAIGMGLYLTGRV